MAEVSRKFSFSLSIGGGLVLFALLVAALLGSETFVRGWMTLAQAGLALPLGSATLLMVWMLTGGRWIHVLGPALRTMAGLAPWAVLLFVPLLFFPEIFLYWTHVEYAELAEKRHVFANTPFLLGRVVAYALVFALLPLFVVRQARKKAKDPALECKRTGCIGIIVLALTVYFFAVDTMMALEPHWYSTMFPFALFITQSVTAYAAACLVSRGSNEPQQVRYAGNLLLALLCFWMYLIFMQFLIIWMGNLPVEVPWYQHRLESVWQAFTVVILGVGIGVPFFFLLPLSSRMHRARVKRAAAMVLLGQAGYFAWLHMPHAADGSVVFRAATGLAAAFAVFGLMAGGVLLRQRKEVADE